MVVFRHPQRNYDVGINNAINDVTFCEGLWIDHGGKNDGNA